MLTIPRDAHASLRQHGEETYPHECCGVLLGRFADDGSKTVTRIARAGNTRDDSPHNRYHIDPKELIRIQRDGRERGEDIVGFSYVITSVEKGKAVITNSFELAGSEEHDKKFVDESTGVV